MATNNAINFKQPIPLMSARLTTFGDGYVTGDGTVYTVIYDSEEFDSFGSFTPATGTFVAPYTGKYVVTFHVGQMGNLNTYKNTTCKLTISTTNRDYTCVTNPFTESAGNTWYVAGFTTVCDMTAGDTLVTKLQISGGEKNILLFCTTGRERYTYLSTAFLAL